jgi:hypothetical protein
MDTNLEKEWIFFENVFEQDEIMKRNCWCWIFKIIIIIIFLETFWNVI